LAHKFALTLARAGADLVIISRDRKRLAPTEKSVAALIRKVVSLELDVRDPESVRRMAAAAEETLAPIDFLVNDAGCNVRRPALDVTWENGTTCSI
jgi:short-subunit dehydrogenase